MNNNKAGNEEEIRELINKRANAVMNKDVNGAMANISPGVITFDVVDPLQYNGAEEATKRAEQWFSSFKGNTMGLEIHELNITAGGDTAFSHCLNKVSATKADGVKLEMFWRETVCYCKIEGKWIITHQHSSVPFNPETGKASLDLKP